MASEPSTSANRDHQITEDYSCGYCLQRLPYMINPKQLPCKHIFCLACLQADADELSPLTCVVCGQSQDKVGMAGLPSFDLDTLEAKPMDLSQEQTCDLCEETPVSLCTTCVKALCGQHVKIHDRYPGMFQANSHDMVTMEQYMENPNQYKLERCEKHGEIIYHACSNCFTSFCGKCEIGDHCHGNQGASSEKAPHLIRNVSTVAGAIRRELKENKLKSLSDKITETCVQEKKGWQFTDAIKEKADEMIERIDRVAQAQISRIEAQSSAMKKEVSLHFEQSIDCMERWTGNVQSRRDELKELWGSSKEVCTNGTDVCVIKTRKVSRLEKELEIPNSPHCDQLFKPILQSTNDAEVDQKLYLDLKIPSPSSAQRIRETLQPSTAMCTTRDRGYILCQKQQVIKLDKNLQISDVGPLAGGVDVSETESGVVVLCEVMSSSADTDSTTSYTLNLLDQNLKTVKTVCVVKNFGAIPAVTSWKLSSRVLLATGDEISVCDRDLDKLFTKHTRIPPASLCSSSPAPSQSGIFSFKVPQPSCSGMWDAPAPQPLAFAQPSIFSSCSPKANQASSLFGSSFLQPSGSGVRSAKAPQYLFSQPPKPAPATEKLCTNVHAVTENCFVLSRQKSNSPVSKYQIRGTSVECLWTSGEIFNSGSISSDAAGYIYISDHPSSIAVLSGGNGQKVCTISLPDLVNAKISDISVDGNELSVATKGDDTGLKIYKIIRKSTD